MTIKEAITDLNRAYKEIRRDYELECIECDFEDKHHPNKKLYIEQRLAEYINNNLINIIDKHEISIPAYYWSINIELSETPEFKYMTQRELKLLKEILRVKFINDLTLTGNLTIL